MYVPLVSTPTHAHTLPPTHLHTHPLTHTHAHPTLPHPHTLEPLLLEADTKLVYETETGIAAERERWWWPFFGEAARWPAGMATPGLKGGMQTPVKQPTHHPNNTSKLLYESSQTQ